MERTQEDVARFHSDMARIKANKIKTDRVRGLREMADALEMADLPDDAIPSVTIHLFPKSKNELVAWAKVIGGKFEKNGGDDWLWLEQKFAGGCELHISLPRTEICELVKIGTKIVPAIPAQPERVEDIYEWHCPESIFSERSIP